MTCATVTLLLFGWCREEEALGENPRSFGHPSTPTSGLSSIQYPGGLGGCTAGSEVSDASLVLTAILGGFSGVVGEALPLGVDDNLSMPLVSGAIFLALQKYVGEPGPF